MTNWYLIFCNRVWLIGIQFYKIIYDRLVPNLLLMPIVKHLITVHTIIHFIVFIGIYNIKNLNNCTVSICKYNNLFPIGPKHKVMYN